ncbi:hypothetical protein SFB10_2477 [Serratia liquefaciens]|nr:hypothetical protein SFB10_2477 [Serratia liquefaciens]
MVSLKDTVEVSLWVVLKETLGHLQIDRDMDAQFL